MAASGPRRPRRVPSADGGAARAVAPPSVAEAAVAAARGAGSTGRVGYSRIAGPCPPGRDAEEGGGGARAGVLPRVPWLLLPCGLLGGAAVLLSGQPAGAGARRGGGKVLLSEEAIGCGRRGCDSYLPEEACQCNQDCEEHGNCCADYGSACAHPRELDQEVHGVGSCNVYGCVEYSHALACQCNDGCLGHGNCCSDFASTCGGVQPLSATGDAPTVAPGQGQRPAVEWSSNDGHRGSRDPAVPSVLSQGGAAEDPGPPAAAVPAPPPSAQAPAPPATAAPTPLPPTAAPPTAAPPTAAPPTTAPPTTAPPTTAPTAAPDPEPPPAAAPQAPEEGPHWCDEAPAVGGLWSPNGGEPPTMHLKVLLYNVHWELAFAGGNDDGRPVKELIAASMLDRPFDLMAFQGCEDALRVLEEVRPGQYIAFQSGGELCTAVRMSQFALISQGEAAVAEDGPSDLQVGNRTAAWARLNHTATGRTVLFVNYHGPTPYNTGGLCGHTATASRLLGLVASNGEPGDTVVLAGDFGASEESSTIGNLRVHLAIANQGIVAGGTDFVLTNVDGVVVSNATNLGNGGSDHDALSTVLRVGPETTTSTTTTLTTTSTSTATTTTSSELTSSTTTTDKRGKVVLHTVPESSQGRGGDDEFVDDSVREALKRIAEEGTRDIAELDDSLLDAADTGLGPAGDNAEEGEPAAEEVAVR